MDGTLFDVNLAQTRASCYPSPSDAFTYGFATILSKGQLRAIGIAGSVVFEPNVWEVNGVSGISASIPIDLPLGYFASRRPPMVYVMGQFGSKVYYKCLRDARGMFSKAYSETNTAGQTHKIGEAPEYQFFVDKLRWDGTTVDGTLLPQWKFFGSLHCIYTANRGPRVPWQGMLQTQDFPLFLYDYPDHYFAWYARGLYKMDRGDDFRLHSQHAVGGTGLRSVMHYYAVGVDAW